MAKVTMPQLGESVAEGTIGKWLKQPGDHVAKYEPLLEVITDKVNAEVPSPFEGILREILAEEGATVPNNAEIADHRDGRRGADAAAARRPGRSSPPSRAAKPGLEPRRWPRRLRRAPVAPPAAAAPRPPPRRSRPPIAAAAAPRPATPTPG